MARPRLRSMFCAPVTAVVLVAVGGCGGAVDEAAETGAVAQPADEGSPPDDSGTTDDGTTESRTTDDGGDDGGGDGGGYDGGADGGTDGDGGGGGSNGSGGGVAGGPDVDTGGSDTRRGAPFDVEAFEQIGASYAEFLEFGADDCDGGRCTLSYEFFENPERTEGCAVAEFRYDPAPQPNPDNPGTFLIQRGASVTVVIGCAPGVDPATQTSTTEEGTTEEGTTEEGTTEEGTTGEGTTEEGTPEEGTIEEGTTEEGTTGEGTTEEGTPEESVTEEGATDAGTTDGTGEGTG